MLEKKCVGRNEVLAEAICRALGGRGGEELLHQAASGPASRGGEEHDGVAGVLGG